MGLLETGVDAMPAHLTRRRRGRRLGDRFPSVDSQHSWLSKGSALSILSIGSDLSIASAGSLLSVLSAGSILSIGSAGSILSYKSAGSILSVRSAGSILSRGSTGSILATDAKGTLGFGRPQDGDQKAATTLAQLVTALAVAGLVGAVLHR